MKMPGAYNLNEDPTERSNLAKKYPEKVAELKAEFEEQAKSHLYPYITWDDVLKGRLPHQGLQVIARRVSRM